MVRVYDPSRTDPSQRLLRFLQERFWITTNKLDEDLALKSILHFLNQKEYEKIKQEFEKNKNFPEIIFKNNCKYQHFFLKQNNNEIINKVFKGYYNVENNKIYLCLNKITNFLELKENFDRELTFAYDYNILNKNYIVSDEEFSKSCISACKNQMENYQQFSEDLKYESTKICSKLLMRVN